jgi:hypothetical protein
MTEGARAKECQKTDHPADIFCAVQDSLKIEWIFYVN